METVEINHHPQCFVLFTFEIPLERLPLSHLKPHRHDADPCSKVILHLLSKSAAAHLSFNKEQMKMVVV